MRIFYTASDIEDLAASGVRQLEMAPGVTLTGAAKELAEQLGVVLVVPGAKPTVPSSASASKAVAPAGAAMKGGTLPARPRGCQHGPLTANGNQGAAAAGGPMVEQLVEAVSVLKKRGG
jgi:hypothetical protein